MNSAVNTIAYISGKGFVRYCLWAVRHSRLHVEGEAYLPDGPAVLAGWHTANLLSLGLHYNYLYRLPAISFIPPGIVGSGMRGMVEGAGWQPVELPADFTGNPIGPLKYVLRSLSGGKLVVIAVDGPFGPAYRVRPGALWLARASGYPLIPMGFAARPVYHWPRWDRQMTPFPGSRIATIIGQPFHFTLKQKIDDHLLTDLGQAIDRLTRRAWEVVNEPGKKQFYSVPTWLPRRPRG